MGGINATTMWALPPTSARDGVVALMVQYQPFWDLADEKLVHGSMSQRVDGVLFKATVPIVLYPSGPRPTGRRVRRIEEIGQFHLADRVEWIARFVPSLVVKRAHSMTVGRFGASLDRAGSSPVAVELFHDERVAVSPPARVVKAAHTFSTGGSVAIVHRTRWLGRRLSQWLRLTFDGGISMLSPSIVVKRTPSTRVVGSVAGFYGAGFHGMHCNATWTVLSCKRT